MSEQPEVYSDEQGPEAAEMAPPLEDEGVEQEEDENGMA